MFGLTPYHIFSTLLSLLEQYLWKTPSLCSSSAKIHFLKILGSEASVTHMLPGGRYFAILHMDDESQSTSYALLMRSSSSLKTR